MGTASYYQPSTALAWSRQAAGPRSSRPGLQLVHRGLRHARFERGQGAVGAAQGMSEIRQWLETTELGQYADAFEANDIDMDLLRQALRDLGMTSAGHRLRIRNAIR